VAELLAVVVLGKSIVGSINLHPDSNVVEARQTENFLGICCLGRVMRNRGRFMILDSSGGECRVAVICLTLTTSKPRFTSPSEISFAGMLCGRWRITTFMGFSDFGRKD
jgi:hypothetical protein